MAETKQLTTRIVIRNDSEANWIANDPVLLAGEVAITNAVKDSEGNYSLPKFKVGIDGIKKWSEIDYCLDTEDLIDKINNIKPTTANTYFTEDMTVTYAFGKYTPDSTGSVTVPTKDKSVYDALLDAFADEKNPTTTQPSLSVSLTGSGAKEVGTQVNPTYSTTFNPGSYQYGPETGVTATSYSISDTNSATATTATGTLTEFTVGDDTNYKITATVNYSDGAIPKTNLGKDYAEGKIVAGSKTATSGSITGYRNSFYGSVTDKSGDITSAVVRGLAGKKNGTLSKGNTFKAAEAVGAMRVIIAVPSPRTCTSIKDENGLNAEALSAFTYTTVNVEGANGYTATEYNVYYKDNASANDKANNWVVTVG